MEEKKVYKRKWVTAQERKAYREANGIEGLTEEDLEDITRPLTEEEAEEMRWRVDPELNRTNTGDTDEYDDCEADYFEADERPEDDEYEQDDDYYDDYDDEDENGI